MNPVKKKLLQKVFEDSMNGKLKTTKMGDKWYYSEDIQSALGKIWEHGYNCAKEEEIDKPENRRQQMEFALNTWIENGQPDENRTEAARRILECFDNDDFELSLSGLGLRSLPEYIGNLTQLTELWMYNNQLTALPESIGNLTQLKRLDVDNNQLTKLPESIGNLTQLIFLDLDNNRLTTLPESIGNLTQLTDLFAYNNKLTALPESIGSLTQLTGLDVNNNQLTALPESIGNLTQLAFLYVDNNPLKDI